MTTCCLLQLLLCTAQKAVGQNATGRKLYSKWRRWSPKSERRSVKVCLWKNPQIYTQTLTSSNLHCQGCLDLTWFLARIDMKRELRGRNIGHIISYVCAWTCVCLHFISQLEWEKNTSADRFEPSEHDSLNTVSDQSYARHTQWPQMLCLHCRNKCVFAYVLSCVKATPPDLWCRVRATSMGRSRNVGGQEVIQSVDADRCVAMHGVRIHQTRDNFTETKDLKAEKVAELTRPR